MKKITILFASLLCSLSAAQTELNRDWYLQKMVVDGVESAPQNEESIARLTYTTNWGDINTQVCMQRSFNMTNITATQYNLAQYSGIAGTCTNSITTDFQTKYFTAFQKTTNFSHSYIVSGVGANQILTLTTSAGDTLIYGTQKVLGVNDIENKAFFVYPNPVEDLINIQTKSNDKISSVALYEMSGKLLFTTNSVQKIDATNLKKGVYLLEISSNNTTQKIKIIKK